MTEHWLKQPKLLPCLTVDECQTIGRCTNHHKSPTNKPSLTGVALSLVQIKYTYSCLQAFITTKHRLNQPKTMPSHAAVECQTVKIHLYHHKTPANKPSLTGTGMSLD